MKTSKMGVCLVMSVLGCALLSGCGGGDNSTPAGPVVSATRQFGDLQFTLSATKAVYARGEAVPLTFTITNVGTQTVNTIGGGCITRFVVQQGDKTVGPESGGCVDGGFTQTFAPGEAKIYPDKWNQKDTQANQSPSGKYTIRYWYNGSNINGTTVPEAEVSTTLAANPIQVTIKN